MLITSLNGSAARFVRTGSTAAFFTAKNVFASLRRSYRAGAALVRVDLGGFRKRGSGERLCEFSRQLADEMRGEEIENWLARTVRLVGDGIRPEHQDAIALDDGQDQRIPVVLLKFPAHDSVGVAMPRLREGGGVPRPPLRHVRNIAVAAALSSHGAMSLPTATIAAELDRLPTRSGQGETARR